MGIDPMSARWRRAALPLSYVRGVGRDRVELPQPKRGVYSALGSPVPSLPVVELEESRGLDPHAREAHRRCSKPRRALPG